MSKTVAIVGTFDTKGEEFQYVKERFEELGINTLTSIAACSIRRTHPISQTKR